MIVIVGPTASGKSVLAVELARRFGGEAVNYDSVQVYRGFDVGSGKLRPTDRQGVPHHLLDIVDSGQVFTAGDYRREAIAVLARLRERGRLPVLVGGTGLYLRALLQGLFEGPQRSETLRARLRDVARRHGGAFLHRMLWRLDPTTAARIHPNDTQKVLRAVEVCWLAKEPMSRLLARSRNDDRPGPTGQVGRVGQVGQVGLLGYHTLKVGLDPDRAALYQRINARVERMFREGLVDEVSACLGMCENLNTETRRHREEKDEDHTKRPISGSLPFSSVPLRLGVEKPLTVTSHLPDYRAEHPDGAALGKPLEALGYRQACALVRGEITMEVAVRDTQTATRQYAKRQMTWFRREDAVTWFRGFGDDPEVQRQIAGWAGNKIE